MEALGHRYSAGLCAVCGEDTVTALLDGDRLDITGNFVDGTRIFAVGCNGDGRLTGVRSFVWQSVPITGDLPMGEKIKLFFLDEDWSPLRQPIQLK